MSNVENIRLNVRVTGELAAYVQEQTSPEGLYEGQSDLVRAALRLHRESQIKGMPQPPIEEIQQDIINGYKEMLAGNFSDKTHEELFEKALENLKSKGIKIRD